jgi:hypothetical protein
MTLLKSSPIILFLAVLALTATAYAVATNIAYIGAEWNHDPVTVYITLDKGVDPSYATEAQTALNDWTQALQDKTDNSAAFNFQVLTSPQSRHNPADITIRIKKNTGAILGSTSISASGTTLTAAKITVSSKNAMGQPLDKADFRNILRHELGHALGLGHANDDGTGTTDLMYPYYDYLTVGTDINPSNLDTSALVHIYGTDGFGGTNNAIPASYP